MNAEEVGPVIDNEVAVWNVLEERSAAHQLVDVTVPVVEVELEVDH